MGRGAVVHLAVLAALAAAWRLPPREIAPWVMLAVLLASASLIGLLVTSTRTQFFVGTIFRGSPASDSVAFTFDDGPCPTFTEQILDVLREHHAKATFFVVGRAAEEHPDLVRRMVAEGHLVASHTYSHAHTFHFWSARAMAADIARGIDVVEKITGDRPRYFRPPQGLRVPTLRDAFARLPLPPTCVTWTVRGVDSVARSADVIIARIKRGLVPGAIITLHDGTAFGGLRSRAPTVAALKELLTETRAKKLRCARLDELLEAEGGEASEPPLPGWRRAIRVCLVTSAFGWFWGGAAVLAWTVLPLIALFVRDPVRRVRACQRVVSAAFRFFHGYMRVLGLLDAVVVKELPRAAGTPVVLVANHTTLVDVTAILSRFPHACCLASARYVDHWLFGRLLRLSGFISAGTDMATRASALQVAVQRLEQGFDVLVFPEGTRSPPHDLLPFQRGAFEIACRGHVPVVPLLLRCQPSALTRDRPFWRQPDRMAILTIEARPPFDPAEAGNKGSALRTRVETSYREVLGLPAIVPADVA